MKFRRFLGLALLVAAGAILVMVLRMRSTAPGQGSGIPRRSRPVVLITVDTTRADHLEPYGAEDVATPYLQRLADRGIVFENAYSVAPITLVAHTSIHTGLNPFQHQVRNNGSQYVPDEVTTLAERLRGEGYRTGAFVSAAVLERRYGLDQGFEIYDDDLSKGRDRSPRMVADRPAEAVVESAVKWLDSLPEDDRYFLWVHFYDPHARYSPPPPYRDEYRERLYDGEIAYMDEQIGRLLRHGRISGTGGHEPAVISVIGDHGESLGEHGEATHAILAYDSTLHVPWIMSVPKGPRGVRVSPVVGQIDFVPTILSLLDLDSGPEVAGRDLAPLLEGGDTPSGTPESYYSETYLPFYTYGWAKLRVLRQGRWKYIDAPRPELYDLVKDPRELSDLLKSQPGTAHDLERDLGEMLAQVPDADAEAALALDSESAEKLRSLGYLAAGTRTTVAAADRPDPKDVIDLHAGLERARSLIHDRLFEPATTVLKNLLRRDPDNLAALVELVGALENLGEIDEAIAMADRALTLDPDYQRLYSLLARLETRRKNNDKALELYRLAVEKDPNNPRAIFELANFLVRLRLQPEALGVLEEAMERLPANPLLNVAYANLAELPKGRTAEAEKRIRSALAVDPFMGYGWAVLGRLLERTDRREEAVSSYRQGLEKQPDNVDLRGALATLLANLGRHAEAESQLREAIRLSPTHRSNLHVTLGGVLAEKGRFDEARKEYDRVLAVDPKNPGARNNSAIALYRAGRLDEAKKVLEELVRDLPNMADAHNNLAAIAIDRGDWKRAEFHSRRTLELNEEAAQAWNNLAISRQKQGDLDEARASFEQAAALDATYWEASFNLAALLREQGEDRTAAATFLRVLTQVPGDAETHLQLGELYAGPLADPARARQYLSAFLRHAPSQHPETARVEKQLDDLPAGG